MTIVGVLLAIGVAVPLVLGISSGVLEIPRNDDWVYRRIALEFAQTHLLQLHGVTTMMIGQVVVAQLFLALSDLGGWAFSAAGTTFAICAVLSAYFATRQVATPIRAGLATLLLLLFPGYLAYATSFMTDVPALAAQLTCIGLGAIAIRGEHVRTVPLAASVMAGLAGFTFREFSAAAPAAVLTSALIKDPRQPTTWLLGITTAVMLGLLFWLKVALGGQSAVGPFLLGHFIQWFQAAPMIALVLLPAALIAIGTGSHRWRRFDVAVGAVIGLVVVTFHVMVWVALRRFHTVFLGNLATQYGVPGQDYLIGGRPLVFPDAPWLLINLAAMVAVVLVSGTVTGIVGQNLRRLHGFRPTIQALGTPGGLYAIFCVAVLVGLGAYSARFFVSDRYFWPLIPAAAAILVQTRGSDGVAGRAPSPVLGNAARIGSTIVAVTLMVTSVALMLNSFAFDSARWRAGELMVNAGFRADEVDAGYEWVGAHQPSLPISRPGQGRLTFYEAWWVGRRSCGIVSSTRQPRPTYELFGNVDYSLFLVGGPPTRLFLYRSDDPSCARA